MGLYWACYSQSCGAVLGAFQSCGAVLGALLSDLWGCTGRVTLITVGLYWVCGAAGCHANLFLGVSSQQDAFFLCELCS